MHTRLTHAASRIAVLGSCIIDVSVTTDVLPDRGESLVASHARTQVGGKASNQAIAISRLGGEARLITRIGDDAWGGIAAQLWQAEGIDTRFVARDSSLPTGLGLVVVDQQGENVTLTYPGASAQLSPDDVTHATNAIGTARVLSLHLNPPLATVTHALEIARAAGVTTILNASPPEQLPESLYRLVDVCIVNQAEAAWLAGTSISNTDEAVAAGQRLMALGVGAVVVSLGRHGAALITAEATHVVPAWNVAAIDTTGAGDALNAGIAVGLAEGPDLLAALRFGVAVSALVVARPGTAAAMPTRAEVERLIGGQHDS